MQLAYCAPNTNRTNVLSAITCCFRFRSYNEFRDLSMDRTPELAERVKFPLSSALMKS